jgi:hypothetical protein
MKLIGKGLLIDTKSGLPFADYGELLQRFGVNIISIPRGDIAGKYTIPVGSQITGHIQWFDINGRLLAGILGGDTEDGGIDFVNFEEHTIPEEDPYTIELNNDDIVVNTELVQDISGGNFKKVEGNPASGEYMINEHTLTFSSGDSGAIIYISYFYNTQEGMSISLNPRDIPVHFELIGKLDLIDTSNEESGDFIIKAKRCVRISDLEIGASAGEVGRFGFEFVIDNHNEGDVVISLPE